MWIKLLSFGKNSMPVLTDLNLLSQLEDEKREENYFFRAFLEGKNSDETDAMVFELNDTIAPLIDCTQCGNCCKSLMVNITEPEAAGLSSLLNLSIADLKEKYIETSLQGQMILNTIPCHFLKGTSCSIYEHRFTECREFPRLNRPGFTERLFSTLMHYGRCPIIFNVVEGLKKASGFTAPSEE